jgi:hypothetical protein
MMIVDNRVISDSHGIAQSTHILFAIIICRSVMRNSHVMAQNSYILLVINIDNRVSHKSQKTAEHIPTVSVSHMKQGQRLMTVTG